MNGLDVNQATYEEVICLIKAAPKSQDIVLWVRNMGKIPVQESAGEPIRWILVSQPALSHSDATDLVRKMVNYQTDDSAVSSGSLGSTLTSGSSSRSADSLSSISSPSEVSYSTSDQDDLDELDSAQESEESLVCVPGGRKSSETFGCGVVKGPDEWPGIFVQNVKPGSLAERVGLQPGDQLMRADGNSLDQMPFELAIGLIKRLQQQQDELQLHIRRGAALRHLAGSKQSTVSQAKCRQEQQIPADSIGSPAPVPPPVQARQDSRQPVRCAAASKLISDTQSQLSAAKALTASASLVDASTEADGDANAADRLAANNAESSGEVRATRSAIKDAMQISATKGLNIINSRRLSRHDCAKVASRQTDMAGKQATRSQTESKQALRPGHPDETRATGADKAGSAADMSYQILRQAEPSCEQRQQPERRDHQIEIVKSESVTNLCRQEVDDKSVDCDDSVEQVKILGQSCKLHHYNRRQLAAVKASRGIICEHSLGTRQLGEPEEVQQAVGSRPQLTSSYSRFQHQRLKQQQQHKFVDRESHKRPVKRQQVNLVDMRCESNCRPPSRLAPISNRINRYLSMESLVEQQPVSSACQSANLRPRFRYVRSSSTTRQIEAPDRASCVHQPNLMCCTSSQRAPSLPPLPPVRADIYCCRSGIAAVAPIAQRRLVRASRARSVDRLNQLVQQGGDFVAANYAAATLGLASASTRRANAIQKQVPGSYCSACEQSELLVYHNYSTATAMISSPARRLPSNCCPSRSYTCCVPARTIVAGEPRLVLPAPPEAYYTPASCCDQSRQSAPRRARLIEPAKCVTRYAATDSSSVCAILSAPYPPSGGASTDSSGYVSETRECRRAPRSSSQPRLLRLCPATGSTLRAPPPPPPPMVTCNQQQLSQRDTRQHLSTFLSPSCLSESSPNSCLYSKPKVKAKQLSPLSSPSLSTDGTSGSAGVSSANCSGATSLSSSSESSVGSSAAPKPPPMPERDLELEVKANSISDKRDRQAADNSRVPASPTDIKSKSDRLCFVDELKLLAKRQQTSTSTTSDSSTLIKIINASRPQVSYIGRKTPAQSATSCTCPARTCTGSGKQSKCTRGSQCKTVLESKSVKLNEQDNKRRQHGEYRHAL